MLVSADDAPADARAIRWIAAMGWRLRRAVEEARTRWPGALKRRGAGRWLSLARSPNPPARVETIKSQATRRTSRSDLLRC
jgi:hypothetical protein